MAVTVWYKGEVDEVIEDVIEVRSLNNKAVMVKFREGYNTMVKCIHLDADTSIAISE